MLTHTPTPDLPNDFIFVGTPVLQIREKAKSNAECKTHLQVIHNIYLGYCNEKAFFKAASC